MTHTFFLRLLPFLLLVVAAPMSAQGSSWLDNLEPITAENFTQLELLHTFNIDRPINAMAWSPTGEKFAVAVPNEVMLFQAYDLEQNPEHLPVLDEEIRSLAFSSSGDLLVSGSIDGYIHLWSVETNAEIESSISALEGVVVVEMDSHFPMLASGGSEGLILWDVSNDLSQLVAIDSGDWVDAVSFSPNSDLLAFSDMYTLLLGSSAYVLQGRVNFLQHATKIGVAPGYSIKDVRFSPTGELLAAVSADGVIHLWRLDDIAGKVEIALGEEFRRWTVGSAEDFGIPVGLIFSIDELLVATGVNFVTSQRLELWNIATQHRVTLIEESNSPLQAIALNPVGIILVSASRDGTIRFWGVRQQGASQ